MAEHRTIKQEIHNFVWILLQRILPAKTYLSWRYRTVFKRKLNWEAPESYSEKLQWLKFYGYRPEYSTMVDKVAVKDLVANVIGDEHIIPTLGVWNRAENINFDQLPDMFVLKCNHNSGEVVICRDKANFNQDEARKQLNRMLRDNYYLRARETPYKHIQRKIFAEQFISNGIDSSLTDYKVYCFDGHAKYILIVQGRDDESRSFDYFDTNWNHIDACDKGEHNNPVCPERPKSLDEMIIIAEKLSANIPHVRVDLYYNNDTVLFGELTFYDGGGFATYDPDSWDYQVGKMLHLPKR